jgi:hypothetical protein
VDAKDPATACKGKTNALLIAASIDFEPTAGDYYDYVGRTYGRPSMSATVALTANDRAIPLGPQTSSSVAAQGPGTSGEFVELLRVAVNALSASEQTLKPGYRWVNVCATARLCRGSHCPICRRHGRRPSRMRLENSSHPTARARLGSE